MNHIRSILVLAPLLLQALCLLGQTPVTITDDDLQGEQDYVWTADTTYLLDGLVYLEAGATLTIEAGTIIRGVLSPSDEASPFSALIISQGATINAKGEPCDPIIFTAEEDDFVNLLARGQWGGLILLGRAPINNNGEGNTNEIFQLRNGDNQAIYGGLSEEDNSGVLTYVSIRYAGQVDGEFSLPGLTLAGVGNATLVDHVEVFTAGGIGIGVRGGKVNTKYMVSSFNGTDAFVYTEGYQGFGQFHFSISLPDTAGRAVQHLGGSSFDPVGISQPIIYNATYIGAGLDNVGNEQEGQAAISFTQESGGFYVNNVMADFAGFGVFVQDLSDSGPDSYQQLMAGNLALKSNAWIQIRSANTGGLDVNSLILPDPGGDEGIGALSTHLDTSKNEVAASVAGLLMSIERSPAAKLDPRPVVLNGIFQNSEPTFTDPFFTTANYRGAFNEDLWLVGWTALDFYDYLPECDLQVNLTSNNSSCFGDGNGSIDLEILGNVTGLVIDWNIDAFDGQSQLNNLAPGTYSVTVTNAECCEQQATVDITGPSSEFTIDCSTLQNASAPGEADGSITVTTVGGGAPNTLVLTKPDGGQENFSFGEGNDLQLPNLTAGDYNAAITDAFGCIRDCDFTIFNEDPCFIIRDDDLVAGGTYTWTAGNCYLLDGLVFLETGGSLTIEPGVIVKGKANPSNGQNTSALIIGKGANITAQGTEANPIVFTAEVDDDTVATDLTAADKGLWGGLAILGDAPIPNADGDSGEAFWEVLDEIGGAGQYGGDGTQTVVRSLSYVSIRHAGAAILPNQVFPALSLVALRETAQLNHLEVFAAADRGLAFYSGTAQVSHAMAAFCQGPAFSWQDGYNGKGQFWFALSDPGSTNLMADHRGYINGATQDTVVSAPFIYNATYIGGGGIGNSTAVAVRFSQASAGVYGNSIFTHFNGNALEVEDIAGDENDSQSLFAAEKASFFRNNLFWAFGATDTIQVEGGLLAASAGAEDPAAAFLVDHLIKNRNKSTDPRLISISNTPDGQLDPRPEDCAAFFVRSKWPDSEFFDTTILYKGAFGGNEIWIDQWTAVESQGYLPNEFPLINPNNCRMQLKPGIKFVSEFTQDATAEYIEREKSNYTAYAHILKECNCGGDGLSRLILWETDSLVDITNCPIGSKDTTVIDTSGLQAVFIRADTVVLDTTPFTYCGSFPSPALPDSQSIVIAILDSGIDLNHFRLAPYPWFNEEEESGIDGQDDDDNCIVDDKQAYDFINNATAVTDIDGHGTHLAGIITERLPSNLQPELMNLKIYEKGPDSIAKGSVFDLICSIHHAINEGAQLINLSLGYWSPEASIPLYNAIKRALENSIPVIISMGNDGANLDERRVTISKDPLLPYAYEDRWPVKYKTYGAYDPDYPNLDSLISVSAAQLNDNGQWDFPLYSNYGDSTLSISTEGIFYSTVPMDSFKTFRGTSMSTAFISKWISIAKALHPDLSVQEIHDCLLAAHSPGTGSRLHQGVGVKLFDRASFLTCMGVSDTLFEVASQPLPASTSVRPNFNVHVYERLVIRFGDGRTFYDEIKVVGRDSAGNVVFELVCQGSIIVWNTILDSGKELPIGDYFLEFFVNGKKLPSPGLQQIIKFN